MMQPTEYEFRTKPFDHQREVFLETADRKAFGLFWEQGTGKTKAIIDTAAYLWEKGEIDTLLVIAPNGVHRNWITDEIPIHMPKRLAKVIKMIFWQSGKAAKWWTKKPKTKYFAAEIKKVTEHTGFRIGAMNYDAIMTDAGLKFIEHMMKDHKVLLVMDESHYVKTAGAKRTIRTIAVARKAAYTRILTGTPIANSPFDAYTQLRVLDSEYWKPYGFAGVTGFKTFFGIFVKMTNNQTGQGFETCVGYQHLDQLKDMIDPITSRVTKDKVLDLPPKLYQRRYFDMALDQCRVYDQLKQDAIALLASGDVITAPLAIVKLLRLQQVTCGYAPADDDGELVAFKTNPRLAVLGEICDGLEHPAIIWARFVKDIDLIMELLGDKAVRYDGQTSDDQRAEAKRRFQDPDDPVKFFVGNPAAGATGITLTAARTVIYYSNSFKLTDRLQSEDRAHRIGQDFPVNYIDIVAPGTVDMHITKALVNKLDISSQLTGDKLQEWIRS